MSGPYEMEARFGLTFTILDRALDEAGATRIPAAVQARFGESAARDIRELTPHLERRAARLIDHATAQLADRAQAEGASMRALLERQRKRIAAAAGAPAGDAQLTMDLGPDDRRQRDAERHQRDADRRAWSRRLQEIEAELESEPRRIAETNAVRAVRVDPVGIVYLWPAKG